MKQKVIRSEKKKPNLVYLSNYGTLRDFPLNHKQYRYSTIDLLKKAERVFNVYYVRGSKRHAGKGIFSQGWKIKKGKFIKYNTPIAAKVVFNKAPLHSNGGIDWTIVNKWVLIKQMQNKYRTYQLFKKFMKPTYHITSRRDFSVALKKVTTEKAVYKPNEGSSGRGIIISKKELLKKKMKSFDGLLQDFIDTSGGVPGVCVGTHDMRILMMDGKIIQTYIRLPKKGSLIANIAQGGTMMEIPLKKVPTAALRITRTIDRYFKKYGTRIYAIDFGFEAGKPYLIELNPQPGLPYKEWSMYYTAWHQGVIRILRRAC